MSFRRRRTVLSRLVFGGAASLGATAMVLAGGVASASAASTVTVTAPQVANTRPADGGWWQDRDDDAAGSFEMTSDSLDGSNAAKLVLPTTAAAVNLHDNYKTADRPTDLPALLDGASYKYTGTNVNFQVEIAYHPNDDQYSATGGTACTSAGDWGISGVDADACYAVLKWEPFDTSTSAWKTVDLSAGTAGNSSTSPMTGGWLSQKRVGSIPPTSARVGHTLDAYLAEVSDYQVVSFGFGAGTGAPAPVAGWVKNVTFGGASYAFTPVAADPVDPPVADSDALAEYIADNDIDVAATSETFSVGDAPAGDGLNSIDPEKSFDATLPWTGEGDSFVDVYAYSTPVHLGTFPVRDGVVILDGVDLSVLQDGSHHLVFIGQSSGFVSVVAVTLAAAPALAATGIDAGMPLLVGTVLFMLGAGALLYSRRRSAVRS
jgi:hypothetical protein